MLKLRNAKNSKRKRTQPKAGRNLRATPRTRLSPLLMQEPPNLAPSVPNQEVLKPLLVNQKSALAVDHLSSPKRATKRDSMRTSLSLMLSVRRLKMEVL